MKPDETPPLPQNINELRHELAGAVPAAPAPVGMVGFYEGKLVVLYS